MRYMGIDLAWGERGRTGLAELDADGRLARSASVRTDDEIADFVGGPGPGVVAAIDAPLIVENDVGRRPCEREIGELFGRHSAGAYPANRGNPAFRPEPRGARLAQRLGWDIDPGVRPASTRSVAIEVYPHPAMVSLFDLDRVIPYKAKKGRDVASRRQAFGTLFSAMESVCQPLRLSGSKRWQVLRRLVESTSRAVDLDTVEDEVDAMFCAYLAWLWTNQPDAMTVIGDVANGYIVTPPPPERRAFTVDLATGSITFGDGLHGAVPPSGANVSATYATGGGSAGAVTTATPTGRCFCGCGASTKPGRYFVPTHDRRAETKVIKQRYGSIAQFVVAHGYGPDKPDGPTTD